MSKNVKVVQNGKWKHVIITGLIGYWCFLNKPKKDHESDDHFYEFIAFSDEATVKALKKLPINSKKSFAQVGVDVKTQGKNAGQVKFESGKYPEVDGLFGFQLKRDAFKKVKEQFRGKDVWVQDPSQPTPIKVMIKEGDKGVPYKGDVGNGSRLTVKCLMTEKDGEYNLKLDTVVIEELVEYSGGVIVDEGLGLTYDLSDFNDKPRNSQSTDEDDVPFDTDDDSGDDVY